MPAGYDLVIQTAHALWEGYTYTRNAHVESSGRVWGDWYCNGGVDSIIAEGTSGNWEYAKFASGLAMCWGIHHEATMEPIGSFNNMSAYQFWLDYPFEFAEVPTAHVTLHSLNVFSVVGYVLSSTDRFNAVCYSQSGSGGFYWKCFAVGKWK